ncbi:MAG: hypothetical protein QM484_13440 [Woeseiaceae bacterium]
MSFFFHTIDIPFWFIVFIFASATPLWLGWYKKFYNKYLVTGVLSNKLSKVKTAAETKLDTFYNKDGANTQPEIGFENSNFSDSSFKESSWGESAWNSSEINKQVAKKESKKKQPKKVLDPVKKKNISQALKQVAEAGEVGILPKTISDRCGISSIDAGNAVNYLVDKKYVDIIESTHGKKYYLTDLGRRYCINKRLYD